VYYIFERNVVMSNENTSTRLKEIMKERNLRQVDLLEMVKPFCEKYNVKINKSDISQYLSGKVKPGQEKLSMLGMALNINETWLMGYDVPKEKQYNIDKTNLSEKEILLLKNFNTLNESGKSKLIEYSNDLIEAPKYIENAKVINIPQKKKEIWEEPGKEYLMPKASHDKDGNFTDEEYKYDNDLMNNDDLWK
jgi:transcriptional regulator with XRE-family HTH domain